MMKIRSIKAITRRILAAFLCLCMLLANMNGLPVAFAAGENGTSADYTVDQPPENSLHFFVRHWHSEESTSGTFQGDETLDNGTRYFVVAEGFIQKVSNTEYKFYLVYQGNVTDENGNTVHSKGDLEEITADSSEYIASVNRTLGSITLKANPVANSEGDVERFSGFSVSAGHKAVSYGNDTITITYDPYVSLVKAHAFYIREDVDKKGTDDATVFGGSGVTGNDPEVDTTYVYVYTASNDPDKIGMIVKRGTAPVTEGQSLEGLLTEGDEAELVKFYSSAEGLHTDKTAGIVTGDGADDRTFNLDLEAWYSEGVASQVGIVLDASGSMAFSSDEPVAIHLDDVTIRNLGITKLPATGSNPTSTAWNNTYFLTSTQIDKILDKNKTDNSSLGVSGYNYFVYDNETGTREYTPIGYWNGGTERKTLSRNGSTITIAKAGDGTVLGEFVNANTTTNSAGWYYVTHNGNFSDMKDLNTGKRYSAVRYGTTFTDRITKPDSTKKNKDLDYGGTGFTYTSTNNSASANTPIRFYVDAKGYLRCFFSRQSSSEQKHHQNSYVYELGDDGYVKVEALQRALGSFVTELSEASPDSEVSAVRFSASANIDDNELDKLVMLDWTTNAGESATILSLLRGTGTAGNVRGGALSYDVSTRSKGSGIKEYNYAITGSTSTWRGLKSFYDNLHPYDDDNKNKYLIIFTDGLDTDRTNGDSAKAQEYAGKLKNEGYTIFTVMLNGGPVVKGTADYNTARNFLITLSGNTRTTTDTQKADFFFSVDDSRAKLEARGVDTSGMNPADILTEIFADEILSMIVKSLKGYTVKDYIDPRFDLVDRNGTVWQLNANGAVTKVTTDPEGNETSTPITITNRDIDEEKIFLSEKSDPDARTPYLRYDSKNDMFYLEWVGQTIPSSYAGANDIPVWNARVTVRAKDDFIGGNAVLSNGNLAEMNWVYHPGDLKTADPATYPNTALKSFGRDATSGTGDMRKTTGVNGDDYPSKGFPRTVVNVAPYEDNLLRHQLIFMGETLLEGDVAEHLIEAAQQEGAASEHARYYWEYLIRYAKANGTTLAAVIARIIAAGDNGLNIPYYYLPNEDETNQPGNTFAPGDPSRELHQNDRLGTLTYRVQKLILNPDNAEEVEKLKQLLGSDVYEELMRSGGIVEYPDAQQSETKDRSNRVTGLEVSFTPLSLEDGTTADGETVKGRTGANGDIVADDDYAWNADRKPADRPLPDTNGVGGVHSSSDPIIVQGGYYTEIVSGEIHLQVELDDALAEKLDGKKIVYVGKLMRNGTQVGTLKYDGKIADGTLLYTATYTPLPDYQYTGYDQNADNQHGLPNGTYTLVPDAAACVVPRGYKWSSAYTEELTEALYGLFRQGSEYSQMDERDLGAYYDDGAIVLGYVAPGTRSALNALDIGDDEDAKPYTDYRFGLFRVTLDPIGDLKLSKTVYGSETEKANDTFDFKVTLYEDADCKTIAVGADGVYTVIRSGSNAPETVTFKNGTATIPLRDGETVTLKGLPADLYYKVEESHEGYITTSKGSTGQIQLDEDETVIVPEAKFINIATRPLTIGKEVTGSLGDPNKDWHFTVTLTPPTAPDLELTGEYPYTMTATDSGATLRSGKAYVVASTADGVTSYQLYLDAAGTTLIALKHNQTITVDGLPYGTGYTVDEVEKNQDGYGTQMGAASDSATGTLTKEDTTVSYINSKPAGGVFISKTVESEEAVDKNITFTFTVTLTDADGKPVNGTYKFTAANGPLAAPTGSTITFDSEGKATVKLKHGQTIHIEEIPAGYKVNVEENSEQGFRRKLELWKTDTRTDPPASTKITDAPPLAIEDYIRYDFMFTNTRVTAYDLTISKTVTGNMGSRDMSFEFTILLVDKNNKAVNATFDIEVTNGPLASPTGTTITFDNEGRATVKLAHDQSVTIKGVPADATYTITEGDGAYQTTVTTSGHVDPTQNTKNVEGTTASGVIDNDITVVYTNDLQVGIPTNATMEYRWLIPIALILTVGIGIFLIPHRRRKLE